MRTRIAAALLCLSIAAGGCSSGDATDDASPTTAEPTTTAAPFEFDPAVEVDYPPQPDGVAWPTDGWETGPLPDGADAAAVEATLDRAFGALSTGINANTSTRSSWSTAVASSWSGTAPASATAPPATAPGRWPRASRPC